MGMLFEQLPDNIKNALNKVETSFDKVVPWLANLYDSKTGGFHMAMSGKNDPDMDPALEMTAWGIIILKDYTDAMDNISEQIREKFIGFYKALLVL